MKDFIVFFSFFINWNFLFIQTRRLNKFSPLSLFFLLLCYTSHYWLIYSTLSAFTVSNSSDITCSLYSDSGTFFSNKASIYRAIILYVEHKLKKTLQATNISVFSSSSYYWFYFPECSFRYTIDRVCFSIFLYYLDFC